MGRLENMALVAGMAAVGLEGCAMPNIKASASHPLYGTYSLETGSNAQDGHPVLTGGVPPQEMRADEVRAQLIAGVKKSIPFNQMGVGGEPELACATDLNNEDPFLVARETATKQTQAQWRTRLCNDAVLANGSTQFDETCAVSVPRVIAEAGSRGDFRNYRPDGSRITAQACVITTARAIEISPEDAAAAKQKAAAEKVAADAERAERERQMAEFYRSQNAEYVLCEGFKARVNTECDDVRSDMCRQLVADAANKGCSLDFALQLRDRR